LAILRYDYKRFGGLGDRIVKVVTTTTPSVAPGLDGASRVGNGLGLRCDYRERVAPLEPRFVAPSQSSAVRVSRAREAAWKLAEETRFQREPKWR